MCSLLPSPPKHCLLHPSPIFFLQLYVGRWGFVLLLAGLFNALFYLLWPERGWPEPGLLGPTPLDPSHHPHQTGTVEQIQRVVQKNWLILSSLFNSRSLAWLWNYMIKGGLCLLCCEYLLAASALYQGAQPYHQHQADQDGQEDPAIQKWNHQIDKIINSLTFYVRKKNI